VFNLNFHYKGLPSAASYKLNISKIRRGKGMVKDNWGLNQKNKQQQHKNLRVIRKKK
jgi:hypothetical protein